MATITNTLAGAHGISPSRVRSYVLPNGLLSVYCWCQERIVYVEPQVIRDGLTESCGRRGCEAPGGGMV